MFNHRNKATDEITDRIVADIIVNTEEAMEGRKIISAAISDAGIILRLDNGTRFQYTCMAGQYNITR